MKIYIAEQYDKKWSLCGEFECGSSGVMLDRVLIRGLSLKRAKEWLKKELSDPNNEAK